MQRKNNESYEDYKKRRKKANDDLKFKLKGEIFWESKRHGTYKKKLQRNQKNSKETN